jgi:hypothetical protein
MFLRFGDQLVVVIRARDKNAIAFDVFPGHGCSLVAC